MTKSKRGISEKSRPIIRLRSMAASIAVIALVLAGPFLAVWKQVYINASSLRLEVMSDSLLVINREIAILKLVCERLSETERIEDFARSVLGLDYPVSSQIAIVTSDDSRSGRLMRNARDFLASIRKSITRDRG